jgi:hypothetical protein
MVNEKVMIKPGEKNQADGVIGFIGKSASCSAPS